VAVAALFVAVCTVTPVDQAHIHVKLLRYKMAGAMIYV
jgi:hypothetical protein